MDVWSEFEIPFTYLALNVGHLLKLVSFFLCSYSYFLAPIADIGGKQRSLLKYDGFGV